MAIYENYLRGEGDRSNLYYCIKISMVMFVYSYVYFYMVVSPSAHQYGLIMDQYLIPFIVYCTSICLLSPVWFAVTIIAGEDIPHFDILKPWMDQKFKILSFAISWPFDALRWIIVGIVWWVFTKIIVTILISPFICAYYIIPKIMKNKIFK